MITIEGCIYNTKATEQQKNGFSMVIFFSLKWYDWWKDGMIPDSLARKSQSLVILPQVRQKLRQTAQQKILFLAQRGLLEASGFNLNCLQQSLTFVNEQSTLSLSGEYVKTDLHLYRRQAYFLYDCYIKSVLLIRI